MDLYAIHKSFLDMQSKYSGNSDMTDPEQSRSREEMSRLSKLINMAILQGQMIDPSNLRVYDVDFDSDSNEQPVIPPLRPSSTEFNPSLLLPFGRGGGGGVGVVGGSGGTNNSPNSSGSSRVTLADQFTWGAVVCAGVFVIVFICVMAAWWIHKKQQARIQRRVAQREARRQMAGGPYCIENDVRHSDNVVVDVQRPPSYFEVIGFFDPPPSYNDVLRVGPNGQQQVEANQAYDNAAVTIDELPPPFVEEDYTKASTEKVLTSDGTESSAINSLSTSTMTVIPAQDGQGGSNS